MCKGDGSYCTKFLIWCNKNRPLCTCFYLDLKEVTVCLECSVCLVSKYFLGKYLSELNAFLVEAVDVPCEALEHDLVFEMRKQRTECFRCERVADDDAGRTIAGELLIVVLVVLAAGKCHDLRSYVRAELLLAGASLDIDINTLLALLESDELKRDDIGSLVKELVEGVQIGRAHV